jgi:hypothetical protein
METQLPGLSSLIRNHWKTIFLVVLTFYFLYSWPDIKQGILDGWAGK